MIEVDGVTCRYENGNGVTAVDEVALRIPTGSSSSSPARTARARRRSFGRSTAS